MLKFRVAFLWFFMIVASGCTEKTSEEYIELAKENIAKENISAAIVELKNAIRVNPNIAESRFMLGEIYASQGSSLSAEKELKLALDLGYEANEVLPLLVKVYSLQFRQKEIIDLVERARGLSAEVMTSLLVYKALAHFQLGEEYKAKEAIRGANEISSDSIYSQLGNAYVDLSNKQVEASLQKIDQVIAIEPTLSDAYLLKGQLSTLLNNSKAAVASYEKYKELLPQNIQSRMFLANAYIKNNQFDIAEKEVDQLLKSNPDQPFVNQLKGIIRYQADDFENAKLFIEKAIQNNLSSVPNRVIAGLSAFRLKNYEQAYDHISAIKGQLSDDSPIRKLLIIIQLKLGLNEQAGDALSDFDGLTEDDVLLLSSASSQLLRQGKNEAAKKLAVVANRLDYTNPLNLIQKGILELTLDNLEGIDSLESALELDSSSEAGKNALAKAYLDAGMFTKALELANVWISKEPNDIKGYTLAAKAELGLSNIANVELLYNKVLNIAPANPEANFYFADMNVNKGRFKNAESYLLNVLEVHTENVIALKKYFLINKRLGDSSKGLARIEEAFSRASTNIGIKLLYASALYTDSQFDKFISVFTLDDTDENTSSLLWNLLANVYYKLEELENLNKILGKWHAAQPDDKNVYLKMITLNDMLGNNTEALTVISEAKQKFPDDKRFSILAVYFYIKLGEVVQGNKAFANLPLDTQNSATGHGFKGQLMALEGDYAGAIPKLKEYYDAYPSDYNASLYAKALRDDKRYTDALKFLLNHGNQTGRALVTELQIAELAILSENLDLAKSSYLHVIEVESENINALNNLAYLLFLESDYQGALSYAEKAVVLAPDSPSVLETYSQVLFKLGYEVKAEEYSLKSKELRKSLH
ncbi:XrtA/PEP-CTERM system TPR-repeat protein PrsT [Paraglaciecola sp. 2405UD69-4]|uniref:XrtA/PEP-CTERM system TPR-repeat protein PrsT n=1 Tax=Paraglaciecola sp. 2405UD69-4 TaxID=3391836 RepID=UPI0039C9D475